MSWRYHGHARVDPNNPNAMAACDRCGRLFNLIDLAYQWEWGGLKLYNTHLRVCRQDLDTPFIFNRPIILPADPVPVVDPRPENMAAEDNDARPTPPPAPYPPTPGFQWDSGINWDTGEPWPP